jgi:hypothetical protein
MTSSPPLVLKPLPKVLFSFSRLVSTTSGRLKSIELAKGLFKQSRSLAEKNYWLQTLQGFGQPDAEVTLQSEVLQALPNVVQSVFGSSEDRSILAEELLDVEFNLAFRLMNSFRLPIGSIYSRKVTKMCRVVPLRLKTIDQFLGERVKGTVDDEEWDGIIMAGVNTLALEVRDLRSAEKLASTHIVMDDKRVMAYIICQEWKKAVQLAIKKKDSTSVRLLADQLATGEAAGISTSECRQLHSKCQDFLDE